jgi:hypothetical protein
MSYITNQNETQGNTEMMNKKVCVAAEPARPNKHLESYQAIQEINQVVNELDDLLERIIGPCPRDPEAAKEPREDPTLSEFLNRAPGDIRNKLDSAHQLIASIREELF